MNKPRINSELKNKLFSAETNTVLGALNSLKEKGNKEYLPILFELLLSKPENEIEKEITKLLGTVKDKDTIPVFVEALNVKKFEPIRKAILISCWQNGLDFSPHIDTFIDLIINSDWEIAFEAFTVIENLEHLPPAEEFKETKLKIARALKKANEQKGYFLEEILRMAP